METLSEEFVEKTWQEVSGFSPDRAHKAMFASPAAPRMQEGKFKIQYSQ